MVAELKIIEQGLGVDAEVVRVGAEESPHVDGRGKLVKALALERFEETRRDPRVGCGLLDGEPVPHARVVQCDSDTSQTVTPAGKVGT